MGFDTVSFVYSSGTRVNEEAGAHEKKAMLFRSPAFQSDKQAGRKGGSPACAIGKYTPVSSPLSPSHHIFFLVFISPEKLLCFTAMELVIDSVYLHCIVVEIYGRWAKEEAMSGIL